MTNSFDRPKWLRAVILPAAYKLLPPEMRDPRADDFLVASAWQESRLIHRKQIGGPALGMWQFEPTGGWVGVLTHKDSADAARDVLHALCYNVDSHAALVHNDILAAAFARLLLWTYPGQLPGTMADAWQQYQFLWRPGKPKPRTWKEAWEKAMESRG